MLKKSDDPAATVPEELRELLPEYVNYLQQGLEQAEAATSAERLEDVENFGHKIAGNASMYGLENISRIGADIEDAAAAGNRLLVRAHLSSLRDVVSQLRQF